VGRSICNANLSFLLFLRRFPRCGIPRLLPLKEFGIRVHLWFQVLLGCGPCLRSAIRVIRGYTNDSFEPLKHIRVRDVRDIST
jgi:hypothetical protein